MLAGLGHTVRLIAPEVVRPFVKKGKKNDASDAAAICEAASRPEVKFVPVKSIEQQGILVLHTTRSLLIRQRVMLGNALRGLAAEFGLTVPKGIEKLHDLAALVDADESFPAEARHAIVALRRHYKDLVDGIAALEIKIVAHARHDDMARRLATIPGIGPITASLIAASVVDIGLFKTARQFAAWLGLVPRQHSTGGKTRLGRITKAGNREVEHQRCKGCCVCGGCWVWWGGWGGWWCGGGGLGCGGWCGGGGVCVGGGGGGGGWGVR